METEESTLLNRRIVHSHPPRFGWQLLRLESVATFTCSRCHQTKTARSVAVPVHGSKVLCCNGCYGRDLSEKAAASPRSSSEAPDSSSDHEGEANVLIRQFDPGDPHEVIEDGTTV